MNVTDVLITRTLLGMASLDVNDRVNYRLAAITPGTMSWRRQQATSPFVDGSFTTHRSRDVRQVQVVIDVMGAEQSDVTDNLEVLNEAFDQDYFEFTWTLDGQELRLAGEAADRTNDYDRSRVEARRLNVTYAFPAQPVPLVGAL